MKYKVGDCVRIKSIDWYNRYTNGTEVNCKHYPFSCHMKKYCGQIMTISLVGGHSYSMIEDDGTYSWTDEMIEGLVEEEEIEFTEEDKYWCDIMSESDPTTYVLPQGYQFKDENGNVINTTKIVLEKKKKEYPKTYNECAEIITEFTGSDCNPKGCIGYMSAQLTVLQKLLICRDAYWKIAGDEMGLGKPWEPDYTEKTVKYCLRTNYCRIVQTRTSHDNHPFSFPTPEMRDAFYENFKVEIEQCKELL